MGNHLVAYIENEISETDFSLTEFHGNTKNRDNTVKWLTIESSEELIATRGDGFVYNLKGVGDTVQEYNFKIDDAAKAKSGFSDYTKLYDSDNYKATTIDGKVDYTLAGLEDGQMDAGFLFDDTPLAPLGHFDLV